MELFAWICPELDSLKRRLQVIALRAGAPAQYTDAGLPVSQRRL